MVVPAEVCKTFAIVQNSLNGFDEKNIAANKPVSPMAQSYFIDTFNNQYKWTQNVLDANPGYRDNIYAPIVQQAAAADERKPRHLRRL